MRTVLLIDDDRAFLNALADLLKAEGWSVLEAGDGEAGLALARQHRPSVVVCDLLMPRCNGFQVCRILREESEKFAQTRIVVTSGSGYASDRQNALEAGADVYLVKPIQPSELFRVLGDLTASAKDDSNEATAAPPPRVEGATLRFWGVRGSIPTPGPETVYYGGNTSCVEVRSGGEIIILDSGTGIRPLGLHLMSEFKSQPIRATLLLSHTHWDHIQGFPFFIPAYNPQNILRILGYDGARKGLERTFSSQMESPYFPISLQEMPGNIRIQELKDLEFQVGEIPVRATFMNHPGICVGYRLFTDGGSVCYLPDNELYERSRTRENSPGVNAQEVRHFAQQQDERFVRFVEDAEVLIIDSQYDAAEYATHVGWGHSCVDDTVELAIRAGVKNLFLFHHDPGHSDDEISRMVAHARQVASQKGGRIQIEAAREGLEILLPQQSAACRPALSADKPGIRSGG